MLLRQALRETASQLEFHLQVALSTREAIYQRFIHHIQLNLPFQTIYDILFVVSHHDKARLSTADMYQA